MFIRRNFSLYKVCLSAGLYIYPTLSIRRLNFVATMSTLNFRIKEHTVEGQYIREYRRALLESPEDTLYLSVKQYTPLDGSHRRPGAVTIIGAHANAFPKVRPTKVLFPNGGLNPARSSMNLFGTTYMII